MRFRTSPILRNLVQAVALSSCCGLWGCALSQPGYLDDYATIGGKWQRSDPALGRVASIFSDPGTIVSPTSQPASVSTYPNSLEEFYPPQSPTELYRGDGSILEDEFGEASVYESGIPNKSDTEDGIIILGDDW